MRPIALTQKGFILNPFFGKFASLLTAIAGFPDEWLIASLLSKPANLFANT
jgi:hypothetical protein